MPKHFLTMNLNHAKTNKTACLCDENVCWLILHFFDHKFKFDAEKFCLLLLLTVMDTVLILLRSASLKFATVICTASDSFMVGLLFTLKHKRIPRQMFG